MNNVEAMAIYIDSKETLKLIQSVDEDAASAKFKDVKNLFYVVNYDEEDASVFMTKSKFQKMYKSRTLPMLICTKK